MEPVINDNFSNKSDEKHTAQLVSMRIENGHIKTIFNGLYRNIPFVFYELDTWTDIDDTELIFIHGSPFLYGISAYKEYLKDINNPSHKSTDVVLHNSATCDYQFFKELSHPLILSELYNMGVDLNKGIKLCMMMSSKFAQEHYRDFACHLDCIYDYDHNCFYTIQTHLVLVQFGIVLNAVLQNNGNNIFFDSLNKKTERESLEILSIEIGTETVVIAPFTVKKEENAFIDIKLFFPYNGYSFYPSYSDQLTLHGVNAPSMSRLHQFGTSYHLSSNIIEEYYVEENLSHPLLLNGRKSPKDEIYEFICRIEQSIKTFFLTKIEDQVNYDILLVGGESISLLSSDFFCDLFSLDPSTPVISSSHPAYASETGMLLLLQNSKYFLLFDDE